MNWFNNGKPSAETVFRRGVENGTRNQWFENGNRRSTAVIVDGLQAGERVFWYSSGGKSSVAAFVLGEKHGREDTWAEADGAWTSTKCWVRGKLKAQWLAAEGQTAPADFATACPQ